jgi:DNA-binding protein H-NS
MEIMSKSYAQIVKQIETLKLEAEKIRRSEVDGVITRIKDAIAHYNLTAADLGLAVKAKPAADPASPFKRKKRKGVKAAPAVKYRNDSGGTWGGIGKRPTWLRDALSAGKSLSDFAVK